MLTGPLLDSALAADRALAPACPDEAAWMRLWTAEDLGALTPEAMALRGGLQADRLPWCFIAGYQAAQRRIFPELPAGGWAAFAASEAADDAEDRPGAALHETQGTLRLEGHKNWIAQSRHVAHLLVTLNGPDGRPGRTVLVSADAPGVSLNHRDSPSFLAGMSQGRARFEAVTVDPDHLFAAERARQFGRAEPRCVMLACAAFLLGRIPGTDAPALREDLTALVLALSDLCLAEPPLPRLLAALDRALGRAADEFERQGLADRVPHWTDDKPLIRLYSRRIQQRAVREDGRGADTDKTGEAR